MAIRVSPSSRAAAMQTLAGPGYVGLSSASAAVNTAPIRAMVSRILQLA